MGFGEVEKEVAEKNTRCMLTYTHLHTHTQSHHMYTEWGVQMSIMQQKRTADYNVGHCKWQSSPSLLNRNLYNSQQLCHPSEFDGNLICRTKMKMETF